MVLSIASAQTQRWVYRYDGPGNSTDVAYSIVYGQAPSIEEPYPPHRDFIFTASTLHKRILNFSLALPSPTEVSISLYDISGRLIDTWFISAPKGISFYKRALNLSAGVYFLRAESLDKAITRKIVIVE